MPAACGSAGGAVSLQWETWFVSALQGKDPPGSNHIWTSRLLTGGSSGFSFGFAKTAQSGVTALPRCGFSGHIQGRIKTSQ